MLAVRLQKAVFMTPCSLAQERYLDAYQHTSICMQGWQGLGHCMCKDAHLAAESLLMAVRQCGNHQLLVTSHLITQDVTRYQA